MNTHLRAAVRNLWLGRADTLVEVLTGYGVDEHRANALMLWTKLNCKERGTKLSECLRECNDLVAFGQKNTVLVEKLEEIRDPHFSIFAIAIRNQAVELWNSGGGVTAAGQFWSATTELIRRQYPNAWAEGMMDVGLTLADMTAKERAALNAATNAAVGAVRNLQRFIVAQTKRKEDDPTLRFNDAVGPRINIWINGYGAVANRAAVMAGKDQKMEWRLGVAEHCTSCVKLNGKVKRASWWNDNQVLPRQPNSQVLVCGGWNCKCTLNPTEKPLSRGRMPKLP